MLAYLKYYFFFNLLSSSQYPNFTTKYGLTLGLFY